MIVIYVTKYGKPASGVRVTLSFSGVGRLGHDEGRTDSDGQAAFRQDPGDGTIYVDGKDVYRGRISGSHYFTI